MAVWPETWSTDIDPGKNANERVKNRDYQLSLYPENNDVRSRRWLLIICCGDMNYMRSNCVIIWNWELQKNEITKLLLLLGSALCSWNYHHPWTLQIWVMVSPKIDGLLYHVLLLIFYVSNKLYLWMIKFMFHCICSMGSISCLQQQMLKEKSNLHAGNLKFCWNKAAENIILL
jgi:hypothetical protein